MESSDPAIIVQAIRWHLRQADMSAGDWEMFVAWLEASPAHSDAYQRIAMQDRLIGGTRLALEAANDAGPPIRRSHWMVGSGVAAAAIAVAMLWSWMTPVTSTRYEIATKAGERRSVQLADGTLIEMNGGTTLRLDRANPRVAEVEQGEATLHVRFDAANPFVATSGGFSVRDVGTVFNVARVGEKISVEVSEGSVLFEPSHESVALVAGDALTIRAHDRAITRSRVSPDLVGGWRTGVLSFDGETLDAVFASVRRRYGTEVVLEGDLPHRPFTGMVRLTGVAERDIPHLATMIGTKWRRDGQRWILASEAVPR